MAYLHEFVKENDGLRLVLQQERLDGRAGYDVHALEDPPRGRYL